MDHSAAKTQRRTRRRKGIRKRLLGTPQTPRLSVFRSNQQIYAQIVDDLAGRTLATANSVGLDRGSNTQAAGEVGKQLAEKAKAAGVQQVVFDRGGYRYHGRVKALADAAREGGLKF